jgi:hypothetical protein
MRTRSCKKRYESDKESLFLQLAELKHPMLTESDIDPPCGVVNNSQRQRA